MNFSSPFDGKLGAALREHHLARIGFGDDIPALLAGLAPVEFGMDGEAVGHC